MRQILLGVLLSASAAVAAPRNIVLMIGDDHGLHAGCYGDSVIKTPALDRLAGQGTRFEWAFAAVSSCSPSRAVILSGTYNHANGQYGLAHADHHFRSFENLRTLPALLKEAGYRTAVVGKYHVAPDQVYPLTNLAKSGNGRNGAQMAEAAGRFMSENVDRPFFLLVGFTDPHRAGGGFANQASYRGIEEVTYSPDRLIVPPFLPDTPHCRADLAEYARSVSRLDQGIGHVLDAIERTGHATDTLVIYLSDNGMPWPGAKTTLYDAGIRLPLVIRSPGLKAGVVNQAMVSWVDIAPTILEYAGVKPAKGMVGRSLLPVLEQTRPAGWDTVFGSHTFHEVTMYYPMRMIRTREHKYILNLAHPLERPLASDLWGSPTWQAVLKSGDETYGQRSVQELLRAPREELYDLRNDPHETKNLAADPSSADVLAELRRKLREWQNATADPWVIKYVHE